MKKEDALFWATMLIILGLSLWVLSATGFGGR